MHDAALSLQGIRRSFVQGERIIEALREADLRLEHGEVVALVGPSGAGKSTLLHIAGLLERADAGEIRIKGEVCDTRDDSARTLLRRKFLGFVYQFHHLLPEFSALENVIIPLLIAGSSSRDARVRAQDMLSNLGLGDRLDHRPARLSGGEQQRVAFARALVRRPAVLLADEPTGNLDPETARTVTDVMLREARHQGLSAIVATHNMELAARMDRILRLESGQLT